MSDSQITNGQRAGDDFPPLHAAWLIARSARDAAAAWDRPARPEDVPELADHLHSALRSLSGALLSLTCCIDSTPPQEPHSFEVSQHVYRASMVTGNAGAGLLRDQPLPAELPAPARPRPRPAMSWPAGPARPT